MTPLPDPTALFSDYLRLTGWPTTPEPAGDPPRPAGGAPPRLGVDRAVGRLLWPGVPARGALVAVGNEAVQIAFMAAHEREEPCPRPKNIRAFVRYARDLVEAPPGWTWC